MTKMSLIMTHIYEDVDEHVESNAFVETIAHHVIVH